VGESKFLSKSIDSCGATFCGVRDEKGDSFATGNGKGTMRVAGLVQNLRPAPEKFLLLVVGEKVKKLGKDRKPKETHSK